MLWSEWQSLLGFTERNLSMIPCFFLFTTFICPEPKVLFTNWYTSNTCSFPELEICQWLTCNHSVPYKTTICLKSILSLNRQSSLKIFFSLCSENTVLSTTSQLRSNGRGSFDSHLTSELFTMWKKYQQNFCSTFVELNHVSSLQEKSHLQVASKPPHSRPKQKMCILHSEQLSFTGKWLPSWEIPLELIEFSWATAHHNEKQFTIWAKGL